MGLTKYEYSDGSSEYVRTERGKETLNDLAQNADLAAGILSVGMKATGKGVEALKKKVLSEEELEADAKKEVKESAVMSALRSTGGMGAMLADSNAAMKKGNEDLKAIGKSLLGRLKK